MLYAHILDGRVEGTVELPDDLDPATLFPGMTYVACGAEVGPGWLCVDGAFSPPQPAALDSAQLVAYAADRRWRIEIGGVVVSGMPIATDDRSKIMITGARLAASLDPGWSTVWHGLDGETYPIDAVAMIAISDAVQAHVNQSFATFAAVKAEIEAGTITTLVEVAAAFA